MVESERPGPDPRSGISEDGSWVPAFEGQRPPFQPGHELRRTHGAYASSLKLGARVGELADELRPLIPGYSPADEVALRVLCLALARVERSAAAIEGASSAELERLRADERGWANTIRRYLSDLGLTPSSRAALGLTAVRGRAESLTLSRLAAEFEADERGEGAGS